MNPVIETENPCKVAIATEVYRQIADHGASGFPLEICGFLYGEDLEERLITLSRPVENTKDGDQRRRFEISPRDYIEAEKYALENNLALLGVYHTHPNHPAIPSVHDLAQAMPWFSYVILSVKEGKPDELRSWRIDDISGRFAEETLTVFP